jgi:hypothetical protein
MNKSKTGNYLVLLKYIDEDGPQQDTFDSDEDCDEFIKYNTDRVKVFPDERFEVISREKVDNIS